MVESLRLYYIFIASKCRIDIHINMEQWIKKERERGDVLWLEDVICPAERACPLTKYVCPRIISLFFDL